ncbi:MAG: hypothetical protein ACI9KN_001813 [Gammaproteobacteria bacterium]|jgi:uncharacterized protein (DUF934 family)
MPKVINKHQVIDDKWSNLDDDQDISCVNTKIIVSLERLKRDFESLKKKSKALAVKLEETAAVNEIVPFLNDLQMVVLQFKVFADGRAFSQAKLLRDRHGYQGQIRAVGDVIRDQLSFMQRSGFSQFQLAETEDVNQAIHAFNEISKTYQPDLK